MIEFLKNLWNHLRYFLKYGKLYKEQEAFDKLYGHVSCLNCSMNLGVTYRDLNDGYCYCSHCGYSNEFTDPRVTVIEEV